MQGDLCPVGSLSRGSLSMGVSVQGGLCPGGSLFIEGTFVMETPITVMCRQNASYWNEFLVFAAVYYHPQRSRGKVIFSEACVKNSVHRRNV